MITKMARGKTLGEAMKITNKTVADQLERLSSNKMYFSNLDADASQKTIENYRENS